MTNTTKTTRQSAVKKTTREQQECLMTPLGEENTECCGNPNKCDVPPRVREAEDKISKINLEVREKALKLVEKIIDSCTTAPLDTVHLNNVTKAIELYTAFK